MGSLESLGLESLRKKCVDSGTNIREFRATETPAGEIGLRLVGADQPYRGGGPSGFGCDETKIGEQGSGAGGE